MDATHQPSPLKLPDWQYLTARADFVRARSTLQLPAIPTPVTAEMLPKFALSSCPTPGIESLPITPVNYQILMRRDDLRQRVRILVEGKLANQNFSGLTHTELNDIILNPVGITGYVSDGKLKKMGLIYCSGHRPVGRWHATAIAEQLFRAGALDYIHVSTRGRLEQPVIQGVFTKLMQLFAIAQPKPIPLTKAIKTLESAGTTADGAEAIRQLHLLGLLRLPERAWYAVEVRLQAKTNVYPSYGAFRYFQELNTTAKRPSK